MVISKNISSSFCLIFQLLLVLTSCGFLEPSEYQDSCTADIYRSRLRFCPKGRERMAMGNHQTSKPRETIKDFGYEFKKVDGQHELRDIDTGKKFEFDVFNGDRTLNQGRYEQLGEAITDNVYEYLEEKLKLKKVIVPVGAGPKDPKGFFFMSDDALESEKLMILIHGSGVVRAGQWARSLIINHSFESGTMVPYIEQAKKEGFGVLITNGNHNYDEILNKRIKGSENPQDHFVYVWNHFINNAKAKHIVIVAHSFGGVVVLHGVRNITEAMERIKAVAFTDSVHSVGGHESGDIKEWFKKKTRNWVSSSEKLDTPIHSYYGGDSCELVSAGTTEHVWTSHCAKESVFTFFKEKLEEEEKGNKNNEEGNKKLEEEEKGNKNNEEGNKKLEKEEKGNKNNEEGNKKLEKEEKGNKNNEEGNKKLEEEEKGNKDNVKDEDKNEKKSNEKDIGDENNKADQDKTKEASRKRENSQKGEGKCVECVTGCGSDDVHSEEGDQEELNSETATEEGELEKETSPQDKKEEKGEMMTGDGSDNGTPEGETKPEEKVKPRTEGNSGAELGEGHQSGNVGNTEELEKVNKDEETDKDGLNTGTPGGETEQEKKVKPTTEGNSGGGLGEGDQSGNVGNTDQLENEKKDKGKDGDGSDNETPGGETEQEEKVKPTTERNSGAELGEGDQSGTVGNTEELEKVNKDEETDKDGLNTGTPGGETKPEEKVKPTTEGKSGAELGEGDQSGNVGNTEELEKVNKDEETDKDGLNTGTPGGETKPEEKVKPTTEGKSGAELGEGDQSGNVGNTEELEKVNKDEETDKDGLNTGTPGGETKPEEKAKPTTEGNSSAELGEGDQSGNVGNTEELEKVNKDEETDKDGLNTGTPGGETKPEEKAKPTTEGNSSAELGEGNQSGNVGNTEELEKVNKDEETDKDGLNTGTPGGETKPEEKAKPTTEGNSSAELGEGDQSGNVGNTEELEKVNKDEETDKDGLNTGTPGGETKPEEKVKPTTEGKSGAELGEGDQSGNVGNTEELEKVNKDEETDKDGLNTGTPGGETKPEEKAKPTTEGNSSAELGEGDQSGNVGNTEELEKVNKDEETDKDGLNTGTPGGETKPEEKVKPTTEGNSGAELGEGDQSGNVGNTEELEKVNKDEETDKDGLNTGTPGGETKPEEKAKPTTEGNSGAELGEGDQSGNVGNTEELEKSQEPK